PEWFFQDLPPQEQVKAYRAMSPPQQGKAIYDTSPEAQVLVIEEQRRRVTESLRQREERERKELRRKQLAPIAAALGRLLGGALWLGGGSASRERPMPARLPPCLPGTAQHPSERENHVDEPANAERVIKLWSSLPPDGQQRVLRAVLGREVVDDPLQWKTLKGAAAWLGVHKSQASRHATEGRLLTNGKTGRSLRIAVASLGAVAGLVASDAVELVAPLAALGRRPAGRERLPGNGRTHDEWAQGVVSRCQAALAAVNKLVDEAAAAVRASGGQLISPAFADSPSAAEAAALLEKARVQVRLLLEGEAPPSGDGAAG